MLLAMVQRDFEVDLCEARAMSYLGYIIHGDRVDVRLRLMSMITWGDRKGYSCRRLCSARRTGGGMQGNTAKR